jgi:predicted membrane protein
VELVKYIFALLLILFGVSVITGRGFNLARWNRKTTENTNQLNEVAIFSPVNKVVETDNFTGGEMVMIFSGGEIDLSHVKTKAKSIDLEIVIVFGGGKLILPKDWKVSLQGTAILGGYDNRVDNGIKGTVVLNIKGVAVLGGLEIIN